MTPPASNSADASGAHPPKPQACTWLTTPITPEQRLQRIEALGQRIHGYVQFMCQVNNCAGTSDEAKDRAVRAFYERLVIVEAQLASIHEKFRLE